MCVGNGVVGGEVTVLRAKARAKGYELGYELGWEQGLGAGAGSRATSRARGAALASAASSASSEYSPKGSRLARSDPAKSTASCWMKVIARRSARRPTWSATQLQPQKGCERETL